MTVDEMIRRLQKLPRAARVVFQTAHPDQICDVTRLRQKRGALGTGPLMPDYVWLELSSSKMESL